MQRFVHDLCQGFVPAEILVVELGIACGVNPTKVAHSIELCDCLADEIAEPQCSTILECIEKFAIFVYIRVQVNYLFEDVCHSGIDRETGNVQVSATLLLINDASSE